MQYGIYELILYFFLYSFLGWCAEIAYAAVRHKKFMNRGFLNGPLCPVYGFGMVLILIFFGPDLDSFLFRAIGCGVVAVVLEFFTGALMEKMFHCKWWDYSGYKSSLGGYVCLPFSCLWGIGAAVCLTFLQPWLERLISFLPLWAERTAALSLTALCLLDLISVSGALLKVQKISRIDGFAAGMQKVSNKVGGAITRGIVKRMTRAFPNLSKEGANSLFTARTKKEKSSVFAEGCGFYKLVWLFFIGAFLGDIVETIFCRITMGYWMSRSSVVYGPFSVVWGLGVVVLTLMLHRYRDKSDRYIFIFGTVVGGAYEYICSVFTEIVFGTVFWDYSKIPFNLGGRINLLYCFFWGVVSVVWIRNLYPPLSRVIEKIPKKLGICLSWILVVFMTFDMLISSMALVRYSARYLDESPRTAVGQLLDEKFPDERMERIYPKAIIRAVSGNSQPAPAQTEN
ncbi:MAG TPA: putative ABC transporter permease [Candidatus Eisenbergiella merdipullorum]|uniref:ABC transporter permease n=1 Tax=Candidatus Eisenbergiella merdipullorum TaxID=2838553 RepID=A0A9D2I7V0_9FIRM|nr:putative ABC transporter permease [Candidatus Eisenbergiella merdipullorum]